MDRTIWQGVDHKSIDQLKRQNSASKIKNDKIQIIDDYGIFEGSSGTYKTTLESCGCTDFFVKRSICKHMYRLANELDYFDWSENLLLFKNYEKVSKKLNNTFKSLLADKNIEELQDILIYLEKY